MSGSTFSIDGSSVTFSSRGSSVSLVDPRQATTIASQISGCAGTTPGQSWALYQLHELIDELIGSYPECVVPGESKWMVTSRRAEGYPFMQGEICWYHYEDRSSPVKVTQPFQQSDEKALACQIRNAIVRTGQSFFNMTVKSTSRKYTCTIGEWKPVPGHEADQKFLMGEFGLIMKKL